MKLTYIVLVVSLLAGCAQVPRQSIELSATVGRDVAQLHKSHREMANLLFQRMRQDINSFVDDVYAPYQINKLLLSDREDFLANDSNSLLFVLNASIDHPQNIRAQKDALETLNAFIQVVREEIESFRDTMLAGIISQENEVFSAIDRSYAQVHYANSIVTGHLSSIAKVHETQEELLNEFGIHNLREQISRKLSNTSKKLSSFVDKARPVDTSVGDVDKAIEELTEQLKGLVKGESSSESEK